MASVQIQEYKRYHDGKICTRARLYGRVDGKQKARTLWSISKPISELTTDDQKALERAIASVGKSASTSQVIRAAKKEVKESAMAAKEKVAQELKEMRGKATKSATRSKFNPEEQNEIDRRRFEKKVRGYQRAGARFNDVEKHTWANRLGCTVRELEEQYHV